MRNWIAFYTNLPGDPRIRQVAQEMGQGWKPIDVWPRLLLLRGHVFDYSEIHLEGDVSKLARDGAGLMDIFKMDDGKKAKKLFGLFRKVGFVEKLEKTGKLVMADWYNTCGGKLAKGREYDRERKKESNKNSSGNPTEIQRNSDVEEREESHNIKFPRQEIQDLYNETCACDEVGLPSCIEIAGSRLSNAIALWEQHPDLEWWKNLFRKVAASGFLTGRVEGKKGFFKAYLDFIIDPSKTIGIIEGKYDDRSGQKKSSGRNGPTNDDRPGGKDYEY
jgi:hypothetical protein